MFVIRLVPIRVDAEFGDTRAGRFEVISANKTKTGWRKASASYKPVRWM
jgi:hypothetical protein